MKILVVSPSWIGDTVMSQSLFRTLKALYPEAIIDVIAPLWCRPVLSYMPEVNKTFLMPFDHGAIKIKKRYQLGYALRKKRYEYAYILPNSFKSALIPFFAKIPHRIGWLGEMRYGLLNNIRILNEKDWPLMVERYIALAYDKNIVRSAKDLPRPLLFPRLLVSENEKILARKKFSLLSNRQIIGFCPGAEGGLAKRWPHYHFAELAELLINRGYKIVLFGSIKDKEIADKIFSSLSVEQQNFCCNLVGKTKLEQVIMLIESCRAIVTNDSGLMHISAALGCSLIALYGGVISSPNFTPPLSDKARIIHLTTVNYYKLKKRVILGNYHQSLINIFPKHVLDVLTTFLLEEKYDY